MAQNPQGSSNRRSRDHDPGSMRYTNTDWEAKEALYQRELDEARARSAQMEKTMRWWSDCTASWRDKWSKVRTERNKAREETREVKNKYDILSKEFASIKNEKIELSQKLMDAKKDNEKLLTISENKIVSSDFVTEDGIELRRKNIGIVPSNDLSVRQRASLDSHNFSNIDKLLSNKLSEMRVKLDEACQNLQTEKEQKLFLLEKIEKLSSELHITKMELNHNERTLGSTDSSHSEIEKLQNELQDEIASKQVQEEKIAELKMEIEKIKSENTVQWSKRELLETENIAILKENKKLYSQVCELREQIHHLNRISDVNAYGKFSIDHKLESDVLPVRKTSISPKSSNSSNGSSEANVAHIEKKTSNEEELAITESEH